MGRKRVRQRCRRLLRDDSPAHRRNCRGGARLHAAHRPGCSKWNSARRPRADADRGLKVELTKVERAGAGARFVNIGERCNVTGSARFKKLILAGDYDAAVEVARDQVENGAQIIDVNVDEALLDSEAAMTTFLKRIAAEPDIARVQ